MEKSTESIVVIRCNHGVPADIHVYDGVSTESGASRETIDAAENMFRSLAISINGSITEEEMEDALDNGVYDVCEDSVSISWVLPKTNNIVSISVETNDYEERWDIDTVTWNTTVTGKSHDEITSITHLQGKDQARRALQEKVDAGWTIHDKLALEKLFDAIMPPPPVLMDAVVGSVTIDRIGNHRTVLDIDTEKGLYTLSRCHNHRQFDEYEVNGKYNHPLSDKSNGLDIITVVLPHPTGSCEWANLKVLGGCTVRNLVENKDYKYDYEYGQIVEIDNATSEIKSVEDVPLSQSPYIIKSTP